MQQLNLAEIMTIEHNEEFQITFDYILSTEEEKLSLVNAVIKRMELKKWQNRRFVAPQIDLNNSEILQSLLASLELSKEEILNRANRLKHIEIYDQQRLQEKQNAAVERQEKMAKTWSYKGMYDHLRYKFEINKKTFVLDNDNRFAVMAICFFLSDEPRFVTELKLDFNKGIILRGEYGTGKSDLINYLCDNERKPIAKYSMLEITEEVLSGGGFQPYTPPNGIVYIDDLGTEEAVVNHFGTKRNWFKNFIETYYLKKNEFNRIILSTNLTWDEIGKYYGDRVRSRMAEMFNDVKMTGEDRRKKKTS